MLSNPIEFNELQLMHFSEFPMKSALSALQIQGLSAVFKIMSYTDRQNNVITVPWLTMGDVNKSRPSIRNCIVALLIYTLILQSQIHL